MGLSDILLTLFIFFIFIGLNLFTILAIGIKKIKDNWPLYRCSPTVIPFAGFFGHDTGKNFSYCIQNIQSSYMGELLKPVYYGLSSISKVSSTLGNSTQAIRAEFDQIRNFATSIITSIMGVFLNILIVIQKTIITLKDTLAKTLGIVATILFTLSTLVSTTQSIIYGPPGQLVLALCFHPNTLVKTLNNKIIKMKNIRSGDRLKNGQIVHVTMNINNLDENGEYKENLYIIRNGENNKNIYVSGSHLIFDKEKREFLQVKNYKNAKPSNKKSKKLICFITSNHLIPLGNNIFHDWEDNNGTPSKNL